MADTSDPDDKPATDLAAAQASLDETPPFDGALDAHQQAAAALDEARTSRLNALLNAPFENPTYRRTSA